MDNNLGKDLEQDLGQDKETLENDVDQLKRDLSRLQSDLGSAANTAVRAVEHEGQKLISDLEEQGKALQARAESELHNLEKRVQTKPLSTLLTVFGTGFLLGLLFRRS